MPGRQTDAAARGWRVAGDRKILIVDDDAALRSQLGDQLRLHDEVEVAAVETARQAVDITERLRFDAILLEVDLPDMNGRDLCRLLRRAGTRAPILMMSVANGDADTILSLDSGANDYITKPLRLNVLRARIRAHIRQRELGEATAFTVGPFTFRPGARTLVEEASHRMVRLTEKESAILRSLCGAAGAIVSRDRLLTEIWGRKADAHVLETHVHHLRRKIEPDPQRPQILVTAPGGYRLGL